MTRSDTGSPAPSYRGLLALVILLGALILLALGALIAGMILNGTRADGTGAPYLATLLAPGGRIESAELDGDRILVRLTGGAAGEELVVLDALSGRTIGRIAVNAAP